MRPRTPARKTKRPQIYLDSRMLRGSMNRPYVAEFTSFLTYADIDLPNPQVLSAITFIYKSTFVHSNIQIMDIC